MTSSKSEQTGGQGFAIASLVLGILAIVTALVWYIGIALGVLAIIFGAISMLIIWLVSAALPSLQKSQRDTARRNDVSVLTTDVTSLMTENRGQLPRASDLSTSNLVQVTSVVGDGTPTTETAVYKSGTNCDGAASTRAYAITVLLENGSEYCLGS
jgi:small-conductance mechanosensitive channel